MCSVCVCNYSTSWSEYVEQRGGSLTPVEACSTVLWELELSKRPAAFYLSLFPSHSLSFSISQSVCFDPVCFISQLIWSAVSQSEDRMGGSGGWGGGQKREKLKSCPGNESLGAWGVRRGQREPMGRRLTPLTPLSPVLLSSVLSFCHPHREGKWWCGCLLAYTARRKLEHSSKHTSR